MELTELTPTAWVVTTQPFSANSLLIKTGAGILLVDSPTTPADTAALVEWIESRWQARVRWGIASHWHADASAGNSILTAHGAETISSERTAARIRTDGDRGKQGLLDYLRSLPSTDEAVLEKVQAWRPTVASRQVHVGANEAILIGGEDVRLIYPGPSHSDDSIGIYLPARGILYGGCAVRSDGRIINKGEASPNWADALEQFVALQAEYVVPGHGRRFDPAMLTESIVAARDLR